MFTAFNSNAHFKHTVVPYNQKRTELNRAKFEVSVKTAVMAKTLSLEAQFDDIKRIYDNILKNSNVLEAFVDFTKNQGRFFFLARFIRLLAIVIAFKDIRISSLSITSENMHMHQKF